MNYSKYCVIIPALNPPSTFPSYVEELIDYGFDNIIIINDGSSQEYEYIFDILQSKPECSLLKHSVNLGKGSAIKNAMRYFLNHENAGDYMGVITVDSDGQHTVKDVVKVADALVQNQDALVLGERDFKLPGIPRKSRLGNQFTSLVFLLLYGKKIRDTQTGLRGISVKHVDAFMHLPGNRYEYEINVLISAISQSTPIIDVGIETIYLNNNSESHFNPIRDSIAIYGAIIKSFVMFSISSILSFLVDISLFSLLLYVGFGNKSTDGILFATIFARMGSSMLNYLVNRNYVFKNKGAHMQTLIKYLILCAVQMLCSAGLVIALFRLTKMNEVFIKIVVDTVLFFISFRIQDSIVFSKKLVRNK